MFKFGSLQCCLMCRASLDKKKKSTGQGGIKPSVEAENQHMKVC